MRFLHIEIFLKFVELARNSPCKYFIVESSPNVNNSEYDGRTANKEWNVSLKKEVSNFGGKWKVVTKNLLLCALNQSLFTIF